MMSVRKELNRFIRCGHVMGIVENKEGLIWICTQDNGLFQTTADEKLRSFKLDKNFSCLSIAP